MLAICRCPSHDRPRPRQPAARPGTPSNSTEIVWARSQGNGPASTTRAGRVAKDQNSGVVEGRSCGACPPPLAQRVGSERDGLRSSRPRGPRRAGRAAGRQFAEFRSSFEAERDACGRSSCQPAGGPLEGVPCLCRPRGKAAGPGDAMKPRVRARAWRTSRCGPSPGEVGRVDACYGEPRRPDFDGVGSSARPLGHHRSGATRRGRPGPTSPVSLTKEGNADTRPGSGSPRRGREG